MEVITWIGIMAVIYAMVCAGNFMNWERSKKVTGAINQAQSAISQAQANNQMVSGMIGELKDLDTKEVNQVLRKYLGQGGPK